MSRAVMQQTLNALEMYGRGEVGGLPITVLVRDLREALAQPEQFDPSQGIQVNKVWWDGDKLMAQQIPTEEIYKPAEQAGQQ